MDVIDALNSRFTVRAFKNDAVDKETILKVLEAAIRAPSWADTQPWQIYVAGGDALERIRRASLENSLKGMLRNSDIPAPKNWPPAMKKRMEDMIAEREKATGLDTSDKAVRLAVSQLNYRLFDAPAVIYLCMDKSLGPWSMFDLGLLAQSIMLAATDYGLNTGPAVMLVGYPGTIREALNIPEDLSIVFGIAIGYGDVNHPQNRARSRRRSIQDVANLIGF